MLMTTWLVSGQTWAGGHTHTQKGVSGGVPGLGGGPGGVSRCPPLPPHLEDDDVVVAEGAELAGPGGVVTDHLVNDVLEVQRQLLHRQVLPLRRGGTGDIVTPPQWGWGGHPSPPAPQTCAVARSFSGRRLRPRRSVTTKGSEILSSSYSGGGRDTHKHT